MKKMIENLFLKFLLLKKNQDASDLDPHSQEHMECTSTTYLIPRTQETECQSETIIFYKYWTLGPATQKLGNHNNKQLSCATQNPVCTVLWNITTFQSNLLDIYNNWIIQSAAPS